MTPILFRYCPVFMDHGVIMGLWRWAHSCFILLFHGYRPYVFIIIDNVSKTAAEFGIRNARVVF